MILIHIPGETERLRYIFDFIFSEVYKMPYTLTLDEVEFRKSDLPKFSYGRSRVQDCLYIPSHILLFEKEIGEQRIELKKWNGLPTFFQMEDGDVPFDIFAASFFLVSRYEEYLPHPKDHHNRFKAESSLAFFGGFLDRPLVNVWADEFKKLLKIKFPNLVFPNPVFSFTPTIDIDNAFAYKYKGSGRVTFALIERLVKFEFKKFFNRVNVHLGYKQDPYDSYEKQFKIHSTYNVKPTYFILLGDYGKYDKNISHKNKNLINLVKSLNQNGIVGMHPSYNSEKSEEQLLKEKARLEGMVGNQVCRSRQHYIKMRLPETYRKLIKAGIKEDYSMGYSSRIGFRASTCSPFYFFDIELNRREPLKIYPFAMMDSTLKYYQKLRSKEVIPYLRPIVSEIKNVGGNFVFIFHNESIGNQRNWKNWGDLYENVIKLSLADR